MHSGESRLDKTLENLVGPRRQKEEFERSSENRLMRGWFDLVFLEKINVVIRSYISVLIC